MTRMTWLMLSVFAVALVGCGGNDGPGATADGSVGPGDDAGASGRGGVSGTGGVRITGTGGAADAGMVGTGGLRITGTGGAVDAGVSGTGGVRVTGTGGVRVVGMGGAPGAGGATGAAGAAGPDGAASDAPGARDGATGTDATVLVCQDQGVCSGDNCQTACDPSGKTTFCACIPAGGNMMQLSCATFSCDRDAGATDARPALSACPADVTNQPDCDLTADTVCATSCTARLQTQCVCVPHGGSGKGRWTCGSPGACQ